MGMSISQTKRQLAYLAALSRWPDTPGDLVFGGGGFVSESLESEFLPGSHLVDGPKIRSGTSPTKGATPFARVQCLDVEYDMQTNAHRPRAAMFRLWVLAGGGGPVGPGTAAQNKFDSNGENMVDGNNRAVVNGSGQSQGRDCDQLLDQFLQGLGVVGFLPTVHGFMGCAGRKTSPSPVVGAAIQRRGVDVNVYDVTEQDYYHGASHVAGSGAAGVVTLTWVPAPARFDSALGVVRRGTVSGDAAPTDPTTGGTLISNAVASNALGISDSPGAGIWNYAYWPGYASTVSGTRDQFGVRSAIKVIA